MLKKLALVTCLLLSVCLFAAPPRMAVGDFSIISDNPKLKYVGKGLAEMIAAELSASKGVVLIERERRDKLLEEMEFSLSGLADEASVMKIGALLSADFILFGEIIDMDSMILITCKVVKTESGEIAWQGKHSGSLADYDAISQKLAASALRGIGAEKAAAVAEAPKAAVPAVSAEKKEEAIIAFSGAVESLDKKDKVAAKRQLDVAKAIDPRNPAVLSYLAKLVTNTSKFKVLMENYASYNNPATLGIIRQDSFHVVFSMPVMPTYWAELYEGINYAEFGDARFVNETVSTVSCGYSVPLGSAMGLRISYASNALDVRTKIGTPPVQFESNGGDWDNMTARMGDGIGIGLGARLGSAAAIGAEVFVLARSEESHGPLTSFFYNNGVALGVNAGFLLRNADESLVWDTRASYVNETYELVDENDLTMTGTNLPWPLGLENNLTMAFLGKRFFLVLKNVDTFGLGGEGVSASFMPAAEYFIADWMSVRAGAEGSALFSDGTKFGLGGMGGLTFRIIPWGLDLDLNVSYRMRPSSAVPGYLYPDFLLLMNANWNGVFKKSR
jgi:TolB-like protein